MISIKFSFFQIEKIFLSLSDGDFFNFRLQKQKTAENKRKSLFLKHVDFLVLHFTPTFWNHSTLHLLYLSYSTLAATKRSYIQSAGWLWGRVPCCAGRGTGPWRPCCGTCRCRSCCGTPGWVRTPAVHSRTRTTCGHQRESGFPTISFVPTSRIVFLVQNRKPYPCPAHFKYCVNTISGVYSLTHHRWWALRWCEAKEQSHQIVIFNFVHCYFNIVSEKNRE